MKRFALLLFCVLMMVSLIGTTNAYIVDINAKNNAANNPISIYFEAGTYDILPISTDDGGLYTAWSIHNGDPNSWVHKYSFSSSES